MYPALPKGITIDEGCCRQDRSVQEVFPPFKCVVKRGFKSTEDAQTGILRNDIVIVDAIRDITCPSSCESCTLELMNSAESWRVRRTTSGEYKPIWVPSEHLQPYTRDQLTLDSANTWHSSPSTSIWHETYPGGTESRTRRRNPMEPLSQV